MQINILSPLLAALVACSQVAALLIANLNRYSRDPALCKGFMLQCFLYFPIQGGVFDQHKTAM